MDFLGAGGRRPLGFAFFCFVCIVHLSTRHAQKTQPLTAPGDPGSTEDSDFSLIANIQSKQTPS